METTKLEPRLQNLVKSGISGTDILHGELKNLMWQTEQDMAEIDVDDPIFTYMEGLLDAYVKVYELTYQLSFAISDQIKYGHKH